MATGKPTENNNKIHVEVYSVPPEEFVNVSKLELPYGYYKETVLVELEDGNLIDCAIWFHTLADNHTLEEIEDGVF